MRALFVFFVMILTVAIPACAPKNTGTTSAITKDNDMDGFESEIGQGIPDGGNPATQTDAKTGWSTSGQLTAGIFAPNGPSVSLQANFDTPGDYTIQFEVNPIDAEAAAPGPYRPIRAIATIQWSVEGNTVTRQITVTNGASISGTGQAVKVVVQDQSFALGGAARRYNVSIQVAPGLRPSNPNEPKFEFMNSGDALHAATTIAPGGTAIFSIPPQLGGKAVAVTIGDVSAVPAPIANQTVQVSQVTGSGVNKITFKVYDPRDFFWMPLSAGASAIEVKNNSGAQSIGVSVTIGVDG